MNDYEQIIFHSFCKPTYEGFIGFVKRYLAPHMKMDFVEEEYYRTIWDSMWEHRRVDVQISRGHSKTELIAVWATIYIAVYQPINPFKDKKIYEQLVVSSDYTTVTEVLDRIKDFFTAVPQLEHLLPNKSDGERWNNTKIELRNGSIIHARSIKMKRGLHVDRVVCDDLTTEMSTLSDRETWSYFVGALLPMTTAKQAMIMVDGTPIRQSDIMSTLEKKKGWNHIKMPAIIDWEERRILSPNRFTWQQLMDIREQQGTVVFEAEYMLNPIDDSTSLIKREHIRECFRKTLDINRHRAYFQEVYLGVDFAFSDRVTADWSVFFIIGKHPDEDVFVMLDYIRKRGMSANEQFDYMRELNSVYKFDMIGLEENSIQAVTKDLKGIGLPIKLFRTANVDEKDKKKPDFTSTISVSKHNLIIRLGTTFENQNILIPYKSEEAQEKAHRLLEECVSWAREEGKIVELGVHPDVPMALGYALEVATKTGFVLDF